MAEEQRRNVAEPNGKTREFGRNEERDELINGFSRKAGKFGEIEIIFKWDFNFHTWLVGFSASKIEKKNILIKSQRINIINCNLRFSSLNLSQFINFQLLHFTF